MRFRATPVLAAMVFALSACSATQPTEPVPVDLLSNIEDPLVISHRGGAAVYPEHSMEGYVASAEAGFPPEPDLLFLSDDTPVAIHDTTVDRTMTGITGPVADLTLPQWRTGRIRPAFENGPDASPVTFTEVLDRLGGKILLVPEVKFDATPEQVDLVINMVLERNLEHAMLMQSSDYKAVKRMLDSGLTALYLVGSDLPEESLQQLRADGVMWIGANINTPPEIIDELNTAGFRVVGYTIRTDEELAALTPGFSGFFSDDPWSQTQP